MPRWRETRPPAWPWTSSSNKGVSVTMDQVLVDRRSNIDLFEMIDVPEILLNYTRGGGVVNHYQIINIISSLAQGQVHTYLNL